MTAAHEYRLDGLRYLLPLLQGRIHQIKMVCNERGAIFFSVSEQYADRCSAEIVYREGSSGNALAGMVYHEQIELRRHDAFSNSRVNLVIAMLMSSLKAGMDRMVVERLEAYKLVYGSEYLGRIGLLCGSGGKDA